MSKKAAAGDKAKKSTSKDKGGGGEADAAAAATAPAANPLADFEAGILFSRYDSTRSGVLTADDFRRIWKEAKQSSPAAPGGSGGGVAGGGMAATNTIGGDMTAVLFEAGQVFSVFDKDADGKLNKAEFEALIKSHPDVLNLNKMADSQLKVDLCQPLELITGRLLTHYDETAGISISSDAVDQHRTMGHTVVPLVDAYRLRYERLRALLATKILPRREYLVQLRRQLTNVSAEVEAVRKGIERETLIDTEKMIERLKATESSRLVSISQEEKKLDFELDAIEKLVKQVDRAHEDNVRHNLGLSGVSTTSSTLGSVPHESIRGPRSALMVDLIHQYQDICSQIDKISGKKTSIQTQFQTSDFPRENAQRLDVASRAENYANALQVKDHMLWTQLQNQTKAEEDLEQEKRLCQEYAHEISNWAELTDKLKQETSIAKGDNEKLLKKNRELMDILQRNNLLSGGNGKQPL